MVFTFFADVLPILRVSDDKGPSIWRNALFCCWFLITSCLLFTLDVLHAGNCFFCYHSLSTAIFDAGIVMALLIGSGVCTRLQ